MTDLTQSLESLTGLSLDDTQAPSTNLVVTIQRAWRVPLNELADEQIGRLANQGMGFPFLLDLVWPKLEQDPLFDGGYYPGDVLSFLVRADPQIWASRPHFRSKLEALIDAALARSEGENDAFRESLARR